MRNLLIASTIALAASINLATAQNAPETSPQATQPSEQTNQPSESGAMMRGMMGGRMMRRGSGEGSREGRMMMAHMMARTTAAIFHIRRGDTSIFIKCADNESTQACVAAAGTLLDKFNPPRP